MKTYRSTSLAACDDTINHAFFSRNGGIGNGIYGNLNVSLLSNDDKDVITENRKRCAEHLCVEPDRLVTLAQCHSDIVLTITDTQNLPHQIQADALVTYLPGIALGIQTADCAPVLFFDPVSRIIGATHSGWQGTLKGIHIRTIDAMKKLGSDPENIIAAIGPCLQRESFEVGDEFYDEFIKEDPENRHFFTKIHGRYHFDNQACILSGLMSNGLLNTDIVPHDTYTQENDFFSYRRATHRGEPDYGRQLSAIMLK